MKNIAAPCENKNIIKILILEKLDLNWALTDNKNFSWFSVELETILFNKFILLKVKISFKRLDRVLHQFRLYYCFLMI